MGYNIFETPDHLHRGLHLFAIDNLFSLLNWLRRFIYGDNYNIASLPPEDRWFLNEVQYKVNPRVKSIRLLARKEAQDFFKKHPEFREKKSNRVWWGPDIQPSDEYRGIIEKLEDEYYEFETSGESQAFPEIINSIENLRSAIATESIEEICGT